MSNTEHRSSTRRWLTIAAEVAAVLAVLIPAGAWAVNRLSHRPPASTDDRTATGGAATGTGTPGGVPGPGAAAGGQLVYLVDQLPADTGGTNIGKLPRRWPASRGTSTRW